MSSIGYQLIRIAENLRVNRKEVALADELTRFAQQLEGAMFDPSIESGATNPMLAGQQPGQPQVPGAAPAGNPLAVKQFASEAQHAPLVHHTLTIVLEAAPDVTKNDMMNYIGDIEGKLDVKPVSMQWGVKEESRKN